MAMTPFRTSCLAAAFAAAVVPACRQPDDRAPEPGAPSPVSVTRWTQATELFAEYPPLAAGHTSRFAIHVTRLSDFKPVDEGRVDVRLEGGGLPVETFGADGPSRPGIFGVDVRPRQAGTRTVVIALRSARVSDEHRIDGVASRHGTVVGVRVEQGGHRSAQPHVRVGAIRLIDNVPVGG